MVLGHVGEERTRIAIAIGRRRRACDYGDGDRPANLYKRARLSARRVTECVVHARGGECITHPSQLGAITDDLMRRDGVREPDAYPTRVTLLDGGTCGSSASARKFSGVSELLYPRLYLMVAA